MEIVERPRAHQAERTCPLCRQTLDPSASLALHDCPGCETGYHLDCAIELGGCSTLGCARRGLRPEFDGDFTISPERRAALRATVQEEEEARRRRFRLGATQDRAGLLRRIAVKLALLVPMWVLYVWGAVAFIGTAPPLEGAKAGWFWISMMPGVVVLTITILALLPDWTEWKRGPPPGDRREK